MIDRDKPHPKPSNFEDCCFFDTPPRLLDSLPVLLCEYGVVPGVECRSLVLI